MNFAGPERTVAAHSLQQTADLTVVGGGGHVGIPLVLAFAEAGFRVNVNDLNREVLETLQAGRLPFIEHGGEALLAQALQRDRLVFTDSPAGHLHRPARSSSPSARRSTSSTIRRAKSCRTASIDLLPHLADGQLLVLRSTVFPGTTDWVDGYLKRKGRDLKVAFCPERVVQGNGITRAQGDAADRQRHDAGAAGEAAELFPPSRPSLCSSRRGKPSSPSCSTMPIATSSSRPRTSST